MLLLLLQVGSCPQEVGQQYGCCGVSADLCTAVTSQHSTAHSMFVLPPSPPSRLTTQRQDTRMSALSDLTLAPVCFRAVLVVCA